MGDMLGRGSGFGREFESYVSRREHCTVWFVFSSVSSRRVVVAQEGCLKKQKTSY